MNEWHSQLPNSPYPTVPGISDGISRFSIYGKGRGHCTSTVSRLCLSEIPMSGTNLFHVLTE